MTRPVKENTSEILMVKKINILLLAFVFFLSTTALPVFVHTCSMNNISYEECSGCYAKCTEEYSAIPGKVKSTLSVKEYSDSACCSIKLIDNRVKDNYTSSNDVNFSLTYKLIAARIPAEVILTLSCNNFQVNYHTTSQLQFESNELYLVYSILLI